MSFYRTHADRFRVNRKMCAAGPDKLGYLKSWYLSRLRERAPRLVPGEFVLRITERDRVLSLPTRYNTDDALVLRGIWPSRACTSASHRSASRRVMRRNGLVLTGRVPSSN